MVRPRNPVRTRLAAAGAGAAALFGLAACTADTDSDDSSGPTASANTSSTTTSAPAARAAVVSTAATGGASAANPAEPVVVRAAHGRLTTVVVTNPEGERVSGELSADRTSWRTTEDLGYSRTYRVQAVAVNADGRRTVERDRVTTLTPDNMTQPYLNDLYGHSIEDGGTYGVGMVMAVHFDEPIPNRAKAEKALRVSTSPHVDGDWYWTNDTTAHWRPQHYYTPGTTVSLTAKVYGSEFGRGLYGQSDVGTRFTIGEKRYSVADAGTHQVKVYVDGELERTMPTSMGRGGTVQGDDGPISLATMPGVYTVLNHENPAIMSSNSYGLPASSPYGYDGLVVPYATKISTDGIYLHQLDSTVSVQGRENVSHGCLNLNERNAKWFYRHSRVGDVVKVVHSDGPKIALWQGGDWSVPWSEWTSG